MSETQPQNTIGRWKAGNSRRSHSSCWRSRPSRAGSKLGRHIGDLLHVGRSAGRPGARPHRPPDRSRARQAAGRGDAHPRPLRHASRISLPALRNEFAVPLRLLAIGLPLTILAGMLAGVAVLPGVSLVEALVLSIMLACTDAALGQAVVTDERIPSRIRQRVASTAYTSSRITASIAFWFTAPRITVLNHCCRRRNAFRSVTTFRVGRSDTCSGVSRENRRNLTSPSSAWAREHRRLCATGTTLDVLRDRSDRRAHRSRPASTSRSCATAPLKPAWSLATRAFHSQRSLTAPMILSFSTRSALTQSRFICLLAKPSIYISESCRRMACWPFTFRIGISICARCFRAWRAMHDWWLTFNQIRRDSRRNARRQRRIAMGGHGAPARGLGRTAARYAVDGIAPECYRNSLDR